MGVSTGLWMMALKATWTHVVHVTAALFVTAPKSVVSFRLISFSSLTKLGSRTMRNQI